MRICITIPTYKRNGLLLKLVRQCQAFLAAYDGPNQYEICVLDSEAGNPAAKEITGCTYLVYPGAGFDDKMLNFWRQHASRFDYLFSISDDDLFAPDINPMKVLNIAVRSNAQAVLFNHRDYIIHGQNSIAVGRPHYIGDTYPFDPAHLLRISLSSLPRHIGLVYAGGLLVDNLDIIARFRGTLHLYAVPMLLACLKNTAVFIDYVLCLFKIDGKTDGAWEIKKDVLHGLVRFLIILKATMPQDVYSMAKAGFYQNYFCHSAPLRLLYEKDDGVMCLEEIDDILADAAPDILTQRRA